jgi:hypothetical protein
MLRLLALQAITAITLLASCGDIAMSRDEALEFASRELCPNAPEQVLPTLSAAFDTDFWYIYVGGHGSEARFVIQAADDSDGLILSPLTPKARAYIRSRPARCAAVLSPLDVPSLFVREPESVLRGGFAA